MTEEAQDSTLDRVLRCWGKTVQGSTDPYEFHPALYHMLDVGHVARELLSERASPRWRRVLAGALHADADSLANWVPWLIAMHDIGKISAPFQEQSAAQKGRLRSKGFELGGRGWGNDPKHTMVGQVFLTREFESPDLPDHLRDAWRDMLGGHHGRFAARDELHEAHRRLKHEPHEWAGLRAEATRTLSAFFLRVSPAGWPALANVSAATMALTGFTVLCDWLGSDSAHFPIRPGVPLAQYAQESATRARAAVEAAGFLRPCRSGAPTAFASLFPELESPRPLQLAVDSIPANALGGPCLAIIEAPTGEGKTEAALALAHRLAQFSGTDEIYYALPTTATSNQMFGRVQKYVRDRLGLTGGVKLVHGQAFLVEDDLRIEPLGNGEERNAAPEWFGSDKRKALLMPFGVGTIDQAELAALNVKFVALRLAGLAGKVVILDEVHAYDTYMTTIVERLLNWLSALGASVILLSATLPLSRRAALVRAYGGETSDAAVGEDGSYPSLRVTGPGFHYRDSPPASQPKRAIEIRDLRLSDEDVGMKARWLLDAVADGGCACWITNTVDRAQKLFAQLDALAPDGLHRMLLHSRLPLYRRQELEEELVRRYGPAGERPARGVVIGTQVLEQSLDLDFDVMASDLAPMDFLLQRAGRLHRHRRGDRGTPGFWINADVDAEGCLKLDRAEVAIYDEYILRLTWRALANRKVIQLPADYRPLIQAVYSDAEPAMNDPLREAWDGLQAKCANAAAEARQRVLPGADPEWSFCGRAAQLSFEEREDSAAWMVARTRLGEESLTVIPLICEGNRARPWPDGEAARLDGPLTLERQKRWMLHSIRLGHRSAVMALKSAKEPLPALFAESGLLKECVPLWLTDGQARLSFDRGVMRLTLDPQLGLVINREGG